MRDFLKKHKLIDNMTTTLQLSKVEFVKRLSDITDIGSIGIMSDSLDVFSSSKNDFKGQVNVDGFNIKRKRKLFDTSINYAVANGIFDESNGQLIIETEINGFNNSFILIYVLLIIVYIIMIIGVLSGDINDRGFAIFFIMLHGTLMFTIPYFMMRRSVKRLKHELERELFYLTKSK